MNSAFQNNLSDADSSGQPSQKCSPSGTGTYSVRTKFFHP
jgi:hypothetical protein